jgi:hypothetical protein
LLIYDRSGWVSVQIVSDPKPVVPNSGSREGVLAATPQEKATAFDGYYAYFGRRTVDPSGASVTHHITQSLYPGEWGQNGVRELSINGNRLTLISNVHEMGENHKRRLVWSVSSLRLSVSLSADQGVETALAFGLRASSRSSAF